MNRELDIRETLTREEEMAQPHWGEGPDFNRGLATPLQQP